MIATKTSSIRPGAWLRAALVIACVVAAARTQAALPLLPERDGVPTLAPLIKRVTPGVVNISVLTRQPVRQNPLFRDPFFRRFFNMPDQAPAQPQQSAGSGVIVDAAKGYVMTNHHVIANARSVLVTLKDRRRLEAKVIGSDPGTDIALLQVDASGLEPLELGDSDRLEVGDFVIAIGNPFGLGQTVTSGIVSALGRGGLNVEGYEDFIQTDASINPGNSGGALVNLKGQLIGINTAIIGPAGGNVGIGFAVPVNMAVAVMEQLVEYGEVRRGRIGVLIQDLTPDLAEALGLDIPGGAVVSRVEENSPAARAGVRAGDVIVEIDGHVIDGSRDLRNTVGLVRVGEQIDVTLLREGRRVRVSLEVSGADSAAAAAATSPQALEGARFRELQPDDPAHGHVKGIVVDSVEPRSQAWRNGLRLGDVILAVNRKRVRSLEEAQAALASARRAIALDILRGNARVFVVIR